MNKRRAALYCYANRELPSEKAEQELQRQQNLLEHYAKIHGIELSACYFYIGTEQLNLKNLVLLHMLQASKRKEFDIILLERFELFPSCTSKDIPQICLFSVKENKAIKIGECNAPLFDERAKIPTGAAVYRRDGSGSRQWSLSFLD